MTTSRLSPPALQTEQQMPAKKTVSAKDVDFLLSGDPVASGLRGDTLCVVPLLHWLFDVLAPRRVLSLAPSCALLHLSMCQMAHGSQSETACLHVAEDFSEALLASHAAYDNLRSQLVLAAPTELRLGAEGQFDIIVMHHDGVGHDDWMAQWRKGLTPQGVLVVHGVYATVRDLDPAGLRSAIWRIGDEALALFWSHKAPLALQALAHGPQEESSAYQTLAGMLAARITSLSLSAHQHAMQALEADIEVMKQTHGADLAMLAEKLADLEEQKIQWQSAQGGATAERIRQLEAERDAFQARFEAIAHSTIWTKTAPLRRLVNMLKR